MIKGSIRGKQTKTSLENNGRFLIALHRYPIYRIENARTPLGRWQQPYITSISVIRDLWSRIFQHFETNRCSLGLQPRRGDKTKKLCDLKFHSKVGTGNDTQWVLGIEVATMEHIIYVLKRAWALDFDNIINSGLYGVVDDDCAFSTIDVNDAKWAMFQQARDYTTELFSLSIFLRSRTKSNNVGKHIGKCCCDWSMEEECLEPLF